MRAFQSFPKFEHKIEQDQDYDIGRRKISIFYYYNTYIMSVKAEMRPRTKSNFGYSSDLSSSIESPQHYEVINNVNNLLQFHVNLNINTEETHRNLWVASFWFLYNQR